MRDRDPFAYEVIKKDIELAKSGKASYITKGSLIRRITYSFSNRTPRYMLQYVQLLCAHPRVTRRMKLPDSLGGRKTGVSQLSKNKPDIELFLSFCS